MRKLYTLLAALTLAATTTLAAPVTGKARKDIKAAAQLRHTSKTAKARKAAAAADIVTAQPEGTLRPNYYRTGASLISVMGGIVDQAVDGLWGQIVESADSKTVWLHNPLNAYYSDSWVKAERAKGDTLVLRLPAHFVHESYSDGDQDGYLYKLKATKVTENGETYTTFVPDDDQEAKFVWRNDTLFFANTAKESKLLGMCDNEGNWYGFGDYLHQYVPFNEPTIAPQAPEKAETFALRYTESGQEYGRIAKMVKEGGEVYVSGLSDNLPDAWVKGTLKGTELTFEGGQYMGLDKETESHTFFQPLTHKPVYYDYGDGTGDYYNEPFLFDHIVFTYDAEGGTFSTDSAFCVNQGRNMVNQLQSYEEASFTPWKDKAYTPADATDLYYEPYSEESGFGIFSFAPSLFTADGEMTDPARLRYNIYLDDEKYTFEPDVYASLKEPVTDMPVNYTDRRDFVSYAGLTNVYMYVTGFEKIGVQMIYTGGGETRKSGIVYCDATEAGINGVKAGARVTGKRYTDLSGRRVSRPGNGAYIETVTYADGTEKSVKRIFTK